jgi:predicted secreted protein
MKELRKLTAKIGTTLKLSLESNLTTGYKWEPVYDNEAFVVSSEYHPKSEAVGGGGTQMFKIVPIRKGEFLLKIRYKRPWETEAIKEEKFVIIVTD